MRIAIVGGGVAGLSAALALSSDGNDVLVLERDQIETGDPKSAFAWPRKGVAQFVQPHGFLPLGRRILRDLAPRVVEDLLSVGADDIDMLDHIPAGERIPQDADLVNLGVRRPLIEWGLRRAAVAEPRIEIRPGVKVTGLVASNGSAVPHVRGVTVDGATIEADLTIDAAGRGTALPAWLEAAGGARPGEQSEPCNTVYYSRYFRLRPGREWPRGPWIVGPMGDMRFGGYSVFRFDNRTYAFVVGIPPWEADFKLLKDARAHDALCRLIPDLAIFRDDDLGEPITDVMPMGSLSNTIRDYVPGGEPVALGVLPIGDALCHTNPTFAWGMSIALAHVAELARAAREHDDARDLSADYLAAVAPLNRERFALSSEIDHSRSRRWRGERLDVSDPQHKALMMYVALGALGSRDPHILRAGLRWISVLDGRASYEDDPDVARRIGEAFMAARAEGRSQPAIPKRDELLAAARAAVADG